MARDLLAMPAWERAVAGLHLVMQYPTEVPGVTLVDAMAEALTSRGVRRRTSRRCCATKRSGSTSRSDSSTVRSTSISRAARRSATRRCSSRCCEPKIAILDELDSGLDIDALRDCARRVEAMSNEQGSACW